MDALKAMNLRTSVRNYRKDPVDPDLLKEWMDTGSEREALLPHIRTRFILAEDGPKMHKLLSGHVGYLGNVMDAPHYLICLSEDQPGFLENAGYLMEQMILKAALMNLGTCWISVLKHEEQILKALQMTTDERVVALTPIGYGRISGVERFFNTIFFGNNQPKAAKKHVSDLFYMTRWGHRMDSEALPHPALEEVMEAACLAPSWGNRQPYASVITPQGIYFVVEKEREPFKDTDLNHNRLDGGIHMLYIYLAGKAKGIPWAWSTDVQYGRLCHKALGVPETYEYLGFIAFP